MFLRLFMDGSDTWLGSDKKDVSDTGLGSSVKRLGNDTGL